MDGLLEFLLDILVDGAIHAAGDRRVPLWVRILLGRCCWRFSWGCRVC